MQSDSNLRHPMIYSTTPRQHPYSQPPPVHNTPRFGQPTACEDPVDKDSCYSDCLLPSSPQKLREAFYGGSAQLNHTSTQPNQGTYDPLGLSATSVLGSASTPLMHPSTQASVYSVSNKEPNTGTGSRAKLPLKRQGSSSKRPTPDDFINMILCLRDHLSILLEYVGTDSKYTLAKNHAGMMVRSSIKSQDIASKMREVAEALDAIDVFLGILLELDQQVLKSEQKGCVSLRICFGALTALLGDFSQGGGVENFVSDPHAAVVPREHLGQFRSFNPNLHEVLRRLSEKLEKSMNLYRHRRSPSGSLVAKFQEMSDTLNVWNQYLADSTFASPSRIASDWLRNHPTQVDSRRRNQAYSEQASPTLSDSTRPSPPQPDSNYLSPMSAFAEPPRLPNRGNGRPTGTDASIQYDSLFTYRTPTGVTFYGPQAGSTSSTPFNHSLYPASGGLNGNTSLPPLTDELGLMGHQTHSSNTGQYHGANSGYY